MERAGLNILIAPLEWGLGHAARMIPLIKLFTSQGHNVIVGAGARHLEFFKAETKEVELISFPGYSPSYSLFLPQYLAVLFSLPSLLYHIISEHRQIKKMVNKYNIDIIVSDNRFGLWTKKATTIYVTHQLRIPFPSPFRFLEPAGVLMHRLITNRYDFCWIPDMPGDINLSGKLSHDISLPSNARYTGILSRLQKPENNSPGFIEESTERLVILSGPEPQKSYLGSQLTRISIHDRAGTIILQGKPGTSLKVEKKENIRLIPHPGANEIISLIEKSNSVISRSGYTTIMELVSLHKTALLIPTPGQTEQEYLASLMSSKGWFSTMSQKELTSTDSLPDIADHLPPDLTEESAVLLKEAVNELFEYHHAKQEAKDSCRQSGPDLGRAV